MQIVREKNENAQRVTEIVRAAGIRSSIPWVLAILSGILQVVIFPLPNWTIFCWVAVAPLLIALLKVGTASEGQLLLAIRSGFLLGWLSGIIFYAGSCY